MPMAGGGALTKVFHALVCLSVSRSMSMDGTSLRSLRANSSRSWNTCSAHTAPTPTKAELLARLVTCAAALHLLAEKAQGEYKPYFADRAQQCRKWAADLKEGFQVDAEYITGGLRKFEALAP